MIDYTEDLLKMLESEANNLRILKRMIESRSSIDTSEVNSLHRVMHEIQEKVKMMSIALLDSSANENRHFAHRKI